MIIPIMSTFFLLVTAFAVMQFQLSNSSLILFSLIKKSVEKLRGTFLVLSTSRFVQAAAASDFVIKFVYCTEA